MKLQNETIALEEELAKYEQKNKRMLGQLKFLTNEYRKLEREKEKLKQEKEKDELVFGSVIFIIILYFLVKILIAYLF